MDKNLLAEMDNDLFSRMDEDLSGTEDVPIEQKPVKTAAVPVIDIATMDAEVSAKPAPGPGFLQKMKDFYSRTVQPINASIPAYSDVGVQSQIPAESLMRFQQAEPSSTFGGVAPKTPKDEYDVFNYAGDIAKAFVARPAIGAGIGVAELIPDGEMKNKLKTILVEKYSGLTEDIEAARPLADEWIAKFEKHPATQIAELSLVIYASGGGEALKKAPDLLRRVGASVLYKKNSPIITPQQARKVALSVRGMTPTEGLTEKEMEIAEALKGLSGQEVAELARKGGIIPSLGKVEPRFNFKKISNIFSKYKGAATAPTQEGAKEAGELAVVAAQPQRPISPVVEPGAPAPTIIKAGAPAAPKVDVRKITNPLAEIDQRLSTEKDPDKRELLADNRALGSDAEIFNEPGKEAVREPLFNKALKKLDEGNVPYSYVRIDLSNINGLNSHRGGVHDLANEDIRRVIGDNFVADINNAGGLVQRSKGADELKAIIPGFSKEQTEELIERSRTKGLAIRDQRGLDKIPYTKKNIPEYGALDFAYGVVESIPGKYGEMDRAADAIQGKMKSFMLDKAREKSKLPVEGGQNVIRTIPGEKSIQAGGVPAGGVEGAGQGTVTESVSEKPAAQSAPAPAAEKAASVETASAAPGAAPITTKPEVALYGKTYPAGTLIARKTKRLGKEVEEVFVVKETTEKGINATPALETGEPKPDAHTVSFLKRDFDPKKTVFYVREPVAKAVKPQEAAQAPIEKPAEPAKQAQEKPLEPAPSEQKQAQEPAKDVVEPKETTPASETKPGAPKEVSPKSEELLPDEQTKKAEQQLKEIEGVEIDDQAEQADDTFYVLAEDLKVGDSFIIKGEKKTVSKILKEGEGRDTQLKVIDNKGNVISSDETVDSIERPEGTDRIIERGGDKLKPEDVNAGNERKEAAARKSLDRNVRAASSERRDVGEAYNLMAQEMKAQGIDIEGPVAKPLTKEELENFFSKRWKTPESQKLAIKVQEKALPEYLKSGASGDYYNWLINTKAKELGVVGKPVGYSERYLKGITNNIVRASSKTQKPEGKAAEEEKVYRPTEMVKFIEDKFGVKVKVKNLPGKIWEKVDIETGRVTIRKDKDIGRIMHGVAHKLYAKMKTDLDEAPEAAVEELKKLASEGDATEEGFANFIAHYVLNYTYMRQVAPEYTSFFEKMAISKYRDDIVNLSELGRMADTYNMASASSQILSHINMNPEKQKNGVFNNLYRKIYDSNIDLLKLEKAREKETGQQLPFIDSPYIQANIMQGVPSMAEAMIYWRMHDITGKDYGPGYADAMGETIRTRESIEKMNAYLAALAAKERHGYGQETGLPRRAVDEIIKSATPEMKEAAEKRRAFFSGLLKYMADAGVLNWRTKLTWETMFKNHASFYRVMDEMHKKKGGLSHTDLLTAFSPFKRFSGSSKDFEPPIESDLRNIFTLVSAARKNLVVKKLWEISNDPGVKDAWVTRLDKPPVKATTYDVGYVASKLKQLDPNLDISEKTLGDMLTLFSPTTFMNEPGIVSGLIGGERKYMEVDKDLWESIRSMDNQTSEQILSIINIISKPAAMLRMGSTQASPDFPIKNFVRDAITAFIQNEYGILLPPDIIRGLYHAAKKDDTYWKLAASGAFNSAMVSIDKDYLKKSINEISKAQNTPFTTNPIKLLRAFGEKSEEGMRTAAAQKAIKEYGDTPEGRTRAAYEARIVTVPFRRQGSLIKALHINQTNAYFNPQLQGPLTYVKAFKKNPKKVLLKSLLAVTLPALLAWFRNKDDVRYNEVNHAFRDTNYILNMKTATQEEFDKMTLEEKNEYLDPIKNPIIGLPQPQFIGYIFGTAVLKALELLREEGDPDALKDFEEGFFKQIVPGLVPTFAVPFLENSMNRDFYFGGAIYPKGFDEEGVEPILRTNPYTSETATLFAKGFNAIPGLSKLPILGQITSPAMLENIMMKWSGGLGRYALKGTDVIGDAFKKEKTTLPENQLNDYPVLRGFFPRYPSHSAEPLQDFYNYWAASKGAKNTYDKYLEQKDKHKIKSYIDAGEKYRKKHMNDIAFYKAGKEVAEQLHEMTNALIMLRQNSDVSPKEKAKQQNDILHSMIGVAKAGVAARRAIWKKAKEEEDKNEE